MIQNHQDSLRLLTRPFHPLTPSHQVRLWRVVVHGFCPFAYGTLRIFFLTNCHYFSSRFFYLLSLFIHAIISEDVFALNVSTHSASNEQGLLFMKRPRLLSTRPLTRWHTSPRSLHMYPCEKCHGSMLLDREVDMESGLSLLVLVCINCGRRKQAERTPLPLIEAS